VSRSVLLVPFPEVADAVEPWLERSVDSKPSHGIRAHVTLLFPCPAEIDGIREVLEDAAAFDVEFRVLRRFPETPTLYLEPEPAEPFMRAAEALVERFPDWPPYGGVHDAIVPHLTVAAGDLCDAAEAEVVSRLPLRGRAREAALLTEVEPQRWESQARFPFREA
jgi:hypothetical protein